MNDKETSIKDALNKWHNTKNSLLKQLDESSSDFDSIIKKSNIRNDWREWFAWRPVKTVGGQFIWLKKIYIREQLPEYQKGQWLPKYIRKFLQKKKINEYGTIFEVLSGNYPDKTTQRIILPLIRTVMPSMIASQLVGVQPMQWNSNASIFTMKIKYDNGDKEVDKSDQSS